MKKLLFIATFLIIPFFISAQTEISAFSATGGGYSTTYLTDYQCLGINPANLGWMRNNHKMNLGLLEFAGSIYTEALTRSEVMNDLFNSDFTLDNQGKEEAANKFTDARMLGNASLMGIGFSYQDDKFGGFAFSIRERIMWFSILNNKGADFLFKGYNDPYFDSLAVENDETVGYSTNPQYASDLYEGTDYHMTLWREYNFGYGRQILKMDNLVLYVGAGVKYLVGYGMAQYYNDDENELVGYSALSPFFDVDYDDPTPSQVEGTGYQKVGSGFGFDLGATLAYKDKLKVSLSMTDIGSVTWDGNVYEGRDTKIWRIETEGIDNYNIFTEGELISSDNPPNEPEMWVGINEKKFNLPMALRGGASYRFGEKLEVGADLFLPMGEKVPGQQEAPVFGLGGHYEMANWIQISLGFVSGGEFGAIIPLGLTFYPVNNDKSSWEIGLATRDVSSFFKTDNPTVSAAFGFLRFSFSAKEPIAAAPAQ